MILFANCKINIGLNILSRRDDGYHNIETLMYPVPGLCDAVELLKHDGPEIVFTASGLPVDGPAEKNLCMKAARLMQDRYAIAGIKMHLHKAVPMGAGLGGGSADAAFVIRGLSDLFELNLLEEEMESLAAELGSDTSFFIKNRPAIATGRGEILTPFPVTLSGYKLVIVKPLFSVGTAEAYAGVVPHNPVRQLTENLSLPIEQWKDCVCNDFETSVFAKYPLLKEIKLSMYQQGALYSAMSGSGSAVYGIFPASVHPEFGGGELFVYQSDVLKKEGGVAQ